MQSHWVRKLGGLFVGHGIGDDRVLPTAPHQRGDVAKGTCGLPLMNRDFVAALLYSYVCCEGERFAVAFHSGVYILVVWISEL